MQAVLSSIANFDNEFTEEGVGRDGGSLVLEGGWQHGAGRGDDGGYSDDDGFGYSGGGGGAGGGGGGGGGGEGEGDGDGVQFEGFTYEGAPSLLARTSLG
jgi:hypothetical protein